MYPEMYYEQVVYQDPFLAVRIWQIDTSNEDIRDADLQIEQVQQFNSHWHYHKEIEFLLILQGEMAVFYNQEQLLLREGDIALFGSNEPHTTVQTKAGNLSYIVFQIDLSKYWDSSTLKSMQYFSEVIRPLSALNYVYSKHDGARRQTVRLIREIYKEMNDQSLGFELAVSSRLKTMLLLLLRHDTDKKLNYLDNAMLERLQPALYYIENHLSEKLSINELSAFMNISYTHFIKMFKKAVGMSFTDFVVYKRIKKAEQMLLTSDTSIAEVAEAVGISNLGHFYDRFRRYNGCSPKQFKDRLREPAAMV
ncbi:AraC family transcriptional regulator [Paenibacillus protaetiae]|uniref:AraC family transcriptional regulator n=1 Tax=Paenibacillus protaetiae TaxID=2509456 RepID=A0A4P6FBY0_9BACL|nr:AraC family transcriptional regulator [Paenibacillus protaetiae]QAY68058.1 AraC family transcriptional regulator [Paenibacillus protaetiae]